MDLSGLKWPIIIVVVVAIGWLMTSGGVNYMIKNFTKAQVGADPERDKIDEAGLSRVSNYLILTFQYGKCADVLNLVLDRYGEAGPNYWNNLSRLSACYEEMGEYQKAKDIIDQLVRVNAHELDERVPNIDALSLRANKLTELHELQ
ncbi:MAG: hypothetical protein HYZ00_09680 [Candidatus Hydrogenedentes bacterium]|nr:hypothetical protein [Candidatus Hydrogenedentota bacterium]